MTELKELENGNFEEVCGDSKCSEILNTAGELRAELLVGAFAEAGITNRLTHAFSSNKHAHGKLSMRSWVCNRVVLHWLLAIAVPCTTSWQVSA